MPRAPVKACYGDDSMLLRIEPGNNSVFPFLLGLDRLCGYRALCAGGFGSGSHKGDWKSSSTRAFIAPMCHYTVDREGTLKSKVMVDDGGMATEDLVVEEFTRDKQPDIIASGRATRNVKIYGTSVSACHEPATKIVVRLGSNTVAEPIAARQRSLIVTVPGLATKLLVVAKGAAGKLLTPTLTCTPGGCSSDVLEMPHRAASPDAFTKNVPLAKARIRPSRRHCHDDFPHDHGRAIGHRHLTGSGGRPNTRCIPQISPRQAAVHHRRPRDRVRRGPLGRCGNGC